MLIKKKEAKNFEIPGGTRGLLYPSSPKGDQTIAAIKMKGSYPESGWSVNDISTETIFLTKGEFFIETEKEEYHLSQGDMFFVFPGTKYRIKGEGEAMVFISPSWEKNTNKIVEQ